MTTTIIRDEKAQGQLTVIAAEILRNIAPDRKGGKFSGKDHDEKLCKHHALSEQAAYLHALLMAGKYSEAVGAFVGILESQK